MKRSILLLILILALLVPASLAEEERRTFEGSGFDSPEEAALAYTEAFNAGDVQCMISTFAIETYVDHVDRQTSMERYYGFMLSVQDSNPMPTPYVRDLMVSERYGDIAKQLRWQYLYYAMPEAYGDDIGAPVRFASDDRPQEIRNFLRAFDASPVNAWVGNISFVDFVSPGELAGDVFMSEGNQKNIAKNAACRGCDEIAEIVAHIQISGEDYYQCLECARYGDRWYVQSLMGIAASFLGLDSYSAGLTPVDELP